LQKPCGPPFKLTAGGTWSRRTDCRLIAPALRWSWKSRRDAIRSVGSGAMSDEAVSHIVDGRLLEVLQSAQQGVGKDLASEIKRLQARITSLEAEIANYDVMRTPLTVVLEQRITQLQQDTASLRTSSADTLHRLQERESQLAGLQAKLSEHIQEVHRLR